MRGIASLSRRQPLQIYVEFLSRRFCHMGGEHGVGVPRCEAAAGVGRACLPQSTGRPWDSAAHKGSSRDVGIATVIDGSDALASRIKAAGPVIDNSVSGPSCPTAR